MKISILLIGLLLLVACQQEPSKKMVNACTLDYNPVCGADGITYGNKCMAGNLAIAHVGECNLSADCSGLSGTWIEESKECEGISKDDCVSLGGNFNECASACRNKPDAQICTKQCVIVCKFN